MASMLDVAFDFIDSQEKAVSFDELWNQVCVVKQFDEDEKNSKLPKFYSSLMIDGRFVTLGENIWDLRSRHTYDKVHISMNDVYPDAEEDSLREEDDDMDEDEVISEEQTSKKKNKKAAALNDDDSDEEDNQDDSDESDEEEKENY